jgi:hypothetical protein
VRYFLIAFLVIFIIYQDSTTRGVAEYEVSAQLIEEANNKCAGNEGLSRLRNQSRELHRIPCYTRFCVPQADAVDNKADAICRNGATFRVAVKLYEETK